AHDDDPAARRQPRPAARMPGGGGDIERPPELDATPREAADDAAPAATGHPARQGQREVHGQGDRGRLSGGSARALSPPGGREREEECPRLFGLVPGGREDRSAEREALGGRPSQAAARRAACGDDLALGDDPERRLRIRAPERDAARSQAAQALAPAAASLL